MKIEWKKPWVPYEWQQHCLDNLKDFNVIVAPRQHGKTELATEIGYSIIHSPHIKNPVWCIVSDTAKRVFTLYAKRLNEHFANNEHFNWTSEEQTRFRIPRKYGDYITINIFGTKHNFSALKGETAHYVVIDEYAKTARGYFEEVASPTVDATDGIVICTGTVEANFFEDLFVKATKKMQSGSPNWFSFYFKWGDKWSKQAKTEQQRLKMRDKFDLSIKDDERRWRKEYMCDWRAGVEGAPFATVMHDATANGQIGNYPFNPRYKVGTFWDDGNTTAIGFWQFIAGRPRIIHYKEFYDDDFDVQAKYVREWYRDNKATWDYVIFPHSMLEKNKAVRSTPNWEIMRRLLRVSKELCIVVPRVQNIENKIQNTRNLIKIMEVHEDEHTNRFIRCLWNYSRVVSKATGIVSDAIAKNGWSHGAEAFGELAQAVALDYFDSFNRLSHIILADENPVFRNKFFTDLEKYDRMVDSRKNFNKHKSILQGY